jgi:hypothetical protein
LRAARQCQQPDPTAAQHGVFRLHLPKLTRVIPPVALAAFTLLFFHRLAFTDLILARGDTFAYFYPYWHVRSAAFMAGQLPLWSPDLFMGVPLLANSQIGVFYPPNWIVAPFSPPDGMRLSILLHVFWALAGVYRLARRALGVDRLAALLGAALFGLGGYLGSHVEQINQLQGLAWMPWLFLFLDDAVRLPRRGIPLLAIGLALQFFSGHTQTVFITVFGLGIYALCARQTRALLALAAGGLLALALALPQLLPTLEMTSVSNRRGGLNPNQATAFSFSPFVFGRGLLPSFDQTIFGEYVAYVGVIGLGLALVGVLNSATTFVGARPSPDGAHAAPLRHNHLLRRLRWGKPLSTRATWLIIGLVGLALALGLYNPLYWWLATLPGFNLFRVPARWLALFALALAMLAALGLHSLQTMPRPRVKVLVLVAAVMVVLAASTTLVLRQPDLTAVSLPTLVTLVGWTAALVSLLVLLWFRAKRLLVTVALLELFLAAHILSYNDLAAPEVFDHPRLTTNQLLVYQQESASPVFGRLLSISELLFDPGDRYALEARFHELGLSESSILTAFTSIKMQDTLAANLPMLYGLPSADGFDGGLLPSAYYTAFTSLLLPPNELRTVDGRLREILARGESCRGACIPAQRWLNLMNVSYLITDKIHDLWHEDVAYDTTFERVLEAGSPLRFEVNPPFEATALNLLALCPQDACPTVNVTLTSADGVQVSATSPSGATPLDDLRLLQITFPDATAPVSLQLQADAPITVRAATLVDSRTGDFQQLQPLPWQRVLSSDIELYENSAALPRAFIVTDARFVPDTDLGTEMALDGMRDPAFDPLASAFIAGSESAEFSAAETAVDAATHSAAITEYTPTRVSLSAETDSAAFLIFTDAYYPGWTATVNGVPAQVRRADVMFRALALPAGESQIVFDYRPGWLPLGLISGGAAWMIIIGLVITRRAYRIPEFPLNSVFFW